MSVYDLPTSVEVGGVEREIRWDYRPILDILISQNDPSLDSQSKAIVMLTIFYPGFSQIPVELWEEAARKACEFIDCGMSGNEKAPRLIDWEQDFGKIIGPVNRILGTDARAVAYDPVKNAGGLHWHTFLAAYMEIGECLFSQIVKIRDLKARGKPLDKADREWYQRNRELVDLKMHYTEDEDDLLKEWI